MAALPLPTESPESPGSQRTQAFRARIEELETDYCNLFRETPASLPNLGLPVSRLRQISNQRATRRLIDEVVQRIETFPDEAEERGTWRSRLQERVRQFGQDRFDWPDGYRDLLLADEFWAATVAFVRQARSFAPSISPDDLFQALRNVWIMNSVQMLLDLDVATTPSVFAYSMLYPWTDNFLDQTEISDEAKRRFNRRLGRRLTGAPVVAYNAHEAEVFALVALIEADLPRQGHPDAYCSIEGIHRAQIDSLQQHAPLSGAQLDTEHLLRLSVRKGGASVLPDAYLVAGQLNADEERFMFGYGVFLQFLDDLQDVSIDVRAGQNTLFTAAAAEGPLDRLTGRLLRFIDRCLDQSPHFRAPTYAARKDLIRRNCTALLVGAVADNPRLYSRPFVRSLQSRWPLRFRSIRRLRRHARKQFARLQPVLEARFGTDSVLDLICRAES